MACELYQREPWLSICSDIHDFSRHAAAAAYELTFRSRTRRLAWASGNLVAAANESSNYVARIVAQHATLEITALNNC